MKINKKVIIVSGVVLFVLLGGVLFYIIHNNTQPTISNTTNTAFQYGSRRQNFGSISGQILSINGNSIIVNEQNGNQAIITTTETTIVTKSIPTTSSIIKNGSDVVITGSISNGILNANSVTIPRTNKLNTRTSSRKSIRPTSSTLNIHAGKISNLTSTSFTLQKVSGGATVQVDFGTATLFYQQEAGGLNDLQVNNNITATGAKDSSGSITASSIIIK